MNRIYLYELNDYHKEILKAFQEVRVIKEDETSLILEILSSSIYNVILRFELHESFLFTELEKFSDLNIGDFFIRYSPDNTKNVCVKISEETYFNFTYKRIIEYHEDWSDDLYISYLSVDLIADDYD